MPIPPRGTYVDPNPLPDPPLPGLPGTPAVPGTPAAPDTFGGIVGSLFGQPVDPAAPAVNARQQYRDAIYARMRAARLARLQRGQGGAPAPVPGPPPADPGVMSTLQAAGFAPNIRVAAPVKPGVEYSDPVINSELGGDDEFRRRYPSLAALGGSAASGSVSSGTGGGTGGGSGGGGYINRLV